MRRAAHLTVLLLASASAFAAGEAREIPAPVPVEVLVQQADLVVVGEIESVQPSERLELPGVEGPRGCGGYFQRCSVQVKKVLSESPVASQPTSRPRAASPAGETRTMSTILVYADGAPPEAAVRSAAGQGKNAAARREDAVPKLMKGEAWVLVLKSVPNNPGYYLPLQDGAYVQADEEAIQRYRQACHSESWAWGPARGGLQLAVLNRYLQRTFVENGVVKVRAMVALRNVSAKPIRIPLYPPDHFLAFVAVGPRNEVVRSVPAETVVRTGFTAEDIAVIPPGQLIFISASGVLDREQDIELQVTPGRWEVAAQFSAGRNPASVRLLWSGTVESRPMAVQVPPTAAAMD